MSYQVIARKFRPQTFDNVLGQSHITQTLKRAIETKRIHHAYLFTGARGVGKTSTARILARALNCEKGPTTTPCDECKACNEITQGINLDVREIDGASNTSVDDVRQLREDVRYLPNRGNYRIYIIDEVHMLSTSAFNALLKTLEEPPEHVIFIFATTEPHKIIETILSRCQRYDFRLLTQKQISDQIQLICQNENIKMNASAIHLLAQEARGSMRDAETMLEQVISFSAEDEITLEIITQCLGLIDRKILMDLLSAVVERDPSRVLRFTKALYEQGGDIKHFCQNLLSQLRNLSIVKACEKDKNFTKELLELPENEFEFFQKLASQSTSEDFQRLYRLLSEDFFSINHAPDQRIALEMSLLRMVQSPPLTDITELIQQLKSLRGNSLTQNRAPITRKATPHVSPQTKNVPAPAPIKPIKPDENSLWNQINDVLKKSDPALASALKNAKLVSCTTDTIALGVAPKSFLYEMLSEIASKDTLTKAALKITGIRPVIDLQTKDSIERPKTETQEKRDLAEKLKGHPVIKDIQTIFDANIEDVKPLNIPKTN